MVKDKQILLDEFEDRVADLHSFASSLDLLNWFMWQEIIDKEHLEANKVLQACSLAMSLKNDFNSRLDELNEIINKMYH